MTSRTPRIVLGAIGAVISIIGLIWTLQGLGVIPGSFMTGDQTWLSIGLICLAAGILAADRRRPPAAIPPVIAPVDTALEMDGPGHPRVTRRNYCGQG